MFDPNSTTDFYADNDNVYSRPKMSPMPYTWAKDIKPLWYDNGERIVFIDPKKKPDIATILAAIETHTITNNGRVYYEKHTRSCPICSFPLLAYLLNRKLIGMHKDLKRYYSDMDGRRIYWQVAIHITEKGQALLGSQN